MAAHETELSQEAPAEPAGDRVTRLALLAFAATCLAAAALLLAFPALWDGLLAASRTIYESKVISAILCRP